jgi:hypothetical protein
MLSGTAAFFLYVSCTRFTGCALMRKFALCFKRIPRCPKFSTSLNMMLTHLEKLSGRRALFFTHISSTKWIE